MTIIKNGPCAICYKPLYPTKIKGVYVCKNSETSLLASSHMNVLKKKFNY